MYKVDLVWGLTVQLISRYFFVITVKFEIILSTVKETCGGMCVALFKDHGS